MLKSKKPPNLRQVRGPFSESFESSVGRRTGPNKEPKRENDPDDDAHGANICAERVIVGRVVGQHVGEQSCPSKARPSRVRRDRLQKPRSGRLVGAAGSGWVARTFR